jgi:hypothetical protein
MWTSLWEFENLGGVLGECFSRDNDVAGACGDFKLNGLQF